MWIIICVEISERTENNRVRKMEYSPKRLYRSILVCEMSIYPVLIHYIEPTNSATKYKEMLKHI